MTNAADDASPGRDAGSRRPAPRPSRKHSAKRTAPVKRTALLTPREDGVEQTADLLQRAVNAHRDCDFDKAESLYREVLHREPRDAIALNDLAVLLVQRGRREPAEELIRQAITVKPDYADAHANLGSILNLKGEVDAAIAAFEQAVVAKPDYAEAHCKLARAFERKGNAEKAAAAFERAIASRRDYPEAWFGHGNALKTTGKVEQAIAAYRQAIALKPDFAEAHASLGVALAKVGEIDEAIPAYRRALDLKPESADAHANLGIALIEKGEAETAIAEYRQALALAPKWAHAHFGLSLALLQMGEFAEGWREYEWRWKGAVDKIKPRELPKPQWQGEDLAGKTLLLYAEQGLGDTLQFVRFIPALAARGGRVVLETPGKLLPLLRMAGVAETMVAAGAGLPEFDFHLPLLTLPSVIALTEETIPAEVPYLAADPARVAQWHERLPKGGFRIGIVWQGFPNAEIDKGRSIPLRCFAPLAAIPGVRLISLQKNYGLDQLDALPESMRVETLGPDFDAGPGAFLDTAAVMAELDLVITSDTSIAHVAGALGRPVWIVLKSNPDWRWLTGREDSPWYPTARLFRQRTRGDWDEVMERVAAELAQVTAGNIEKLSALGKMPPADDRADRARAAFDRGFALHRDGLLDAAAAAYCKAVTLDTNHAEAYSNIGVIRHGHGRIDEAITLYRRAVAIKPDHVAALGNLATALTAKGDVDGAIAALRQALAAKPEDADGHLRLGDLLQRKGDTDGAVAAYRQGAVINPDNPKAQFNLAFGLQKKGELDAAIGGYRQAIALDSRLARAHANLGVALSETDRIEEGITECRQALALRPDNPQYHSNLGSALSKADDLDAALDHFQRAVEIDPDYAEAHANLALALLEKGMVDKAIGCDRRAILLKPDYAEAHFNLSLALLLSGEFGAGWQEYEWRWKGGVKELKAQKFAQPQWQGEDLAGKTLLLHAEQGLGDTLQFARFASALAERGARIILAAPRELAALLRSTPGVEGVVGAGEKLPRYDFHLPLMSVPAVLGTTEKSIPANVPYLAADPERIAFWRARLPADGFKVGIVWQGRPDVKIDKGRSVPLRSFAPIADMPGVRLISLQKNHGLDQVHGLPEGTKVETLGAEFDAGPDAFLDTAAVMMSLDLIITSDTSVAHLAGALGRPVWIALKQTPDWRWQLGREDSPWYPTARLFRQRQRGNWTEVFASIANELNRLVSGETGRLRPMTRSSEAKGAVDLNDPNSSMADRSATIMKECRHGRMLFLKRDMYVGRSLGAYGEFSEPEVKIFSQFLKSGDVVAEVGANIGAHTVPIAKLVGQKGLVLAFEPQRVIFQILSANVALNDLFNVRTYHAAVGREAGTVIMPWLDYAAEANFGGVSAGTSGAGEAVQLLELDSLKLPSLRLLKVDVEGMEAEVLLGARQTIAKYRPILYVENDRRAKSEQLIDLLNSFGYRMWWHLPKLFNPKNFANNEFNLFGGTLSVNLLCCPKEVPAQVTDLREVTSPADWWKEPVSGNFPILPTSAAA